MVAFFRRSWRHLLAALVVSLLFLFAVFAEPWAFPRLLASGAVFASRMRSFFLFFLGVGPSSPSLLSLVSSMGDAPAGVDSGSLAGFWQDVLVFFRLLASKGRALAFLSSASSFLVSLVRLVLVCVLLWLLLRLWLSSYFSESSFSWSRSSRPLRGASRLSRAFGAAFRSVSAYCRWFASSVWAVPCAVFLLYVFRFYSYALDLVGVYFWFFASMDFLSLLDFAFSALASFFASLWFVPLWLWLVFAYALFRWLTFRRADRLISRKLIPADQAVLREDTGVFTLILGKMRAGKTKLMTLMAVVQSVNDREDAYAIMDKYARMFPDFPWQAFENDIFRLSGWRRGHRRRIFNIQQAADYAGRIYAFLESRKFDSYHYDFSCQRLSFFDGCKSVSLRGALSVYAQAYYVYCRYDTFIASNYSIRSDEILMDRGHLVQWDGDLFHRDNRDLLGFSTFSHVLRWDMLRLGSKADPSDPFSLAANPGIYVVTEFDKERGNKDTNAAFRQDDGFPNPKNDLFDVALKLGGHIASIDNVNFFKVFGDQQRSGSLSLNDLSVAQGIFTVDPRGIARRNAVPFWWLEPILLEKISANRASFYQRYRFFREDRTLLFSLVSWLGSLAYSLQSFVENRYGYDEVSLVTTSADSSGSLTEGESVTFYAPNFIAFSDRYESACMSDFLNDGKELAVCGFSDLPRFSGVRNRRSEWESQGSYLVADLSASGTSRIRNAVEARKGASGSKPSWAGRGAKGRGVSGGGRRG